MFVCCECCVFSGRGFCDELITRPEESYRLWCVVVCDLEASRMGRPWPALGRSATKKSSNNTDKNGGITAIITTESVTGMFWVIYYQYIYQSSIEGRLATGWTVRRSNPGGGEIFRTCPDRPWGPPSLLYNGYRVFPGGKERPGRDADPSPPSSAVVMKE
jgi:hypothetical protein